MPGATIGLVAPASPPLEPAQIPEAISRLEAHGFRVQAAPHLHARDGYLAGSDQQRADDLNGLFLDPEVDGILALRGGYGSCRILPLLDYEAIRAHPKIYLGYSDNTAIHHALLQEAGLVSLHGPNATEAFLPGNADYLHRLLGQRSSFTGGDNLLLPPSGRGEMTTLIPGAATGRLIGGNMTCLLRLLGTPYQPDFTGAILFLEDIGEKAYRVDGLFTQLRLSGVGAQIKGLVLGRFSYHEEAECARIEQCLQREARALGLPCLSGAPIGHFPEQVVLPQGTTVRLDATAQTLMVDEQA